MLQTEDAAMQEEQPTVGEKRPLEAAGADEEADGQPAAKQAKAEEEGAAEEPEDVADDAEEADGDGGDAKLSKKEPVPNPKTIGHKHFENGQEAYKYYHMLVRKLRKYQSLNDVRSMYALHGTPSTCDVWSSWRPAVRRLSVNNHSS